MTGKTILEFKIMTAQNHRTAFLKYVMRQRGLTLDSHLEEHIRGIKKLGACT